MYDTLEEKVKAEVIWLLLQAYFRNDNKYNFEVRKTDNGTCPCFYNDEATIGITNSLDSNNPTLFIEVLEVKDKGNGLGSEIIFDICQIIDIIGFNLNLWTKKGSKTERWYKKFGFTPTRTNSKGEVQLTRKPRTKMNKYYIEKKISDEHKLVITKFIHEAIMHKDLFTKKATSTVNKILENER
ncbi:GNAT family N-acetyltransferase [Paraclostridium sordellii]|uniref:GNAT family N-acetyltransferase n=1 Tax=Paraclostridium sordellii TaxID=1505 RepID=UPI000C7855FC|nr:GNAT family N-acetyltransferase [Paeniclostridium sordellii]AUN14696.1 hypothetical protein RSJ16_10890 [Paeniclostridium sordellii]MDU5019974.1 GNAT family N-acetyltransferase [Clostridiales bacterium]